MSELLRILVLYYACDVSAEVHFPSPEEWTRCMGHYHEIKARFADDLSGTDAQVVGYQRWKTWEAENPELVASLRERAMGLVSES